MQAFGYEQFGNEWKVVSVKDGLGRETKLNYLQPHGGHRSAGRRHQLRLRRGESRLTDIIAPAPLAGGAALVMTSFIYDPKNGNVAV